MRALHGPILIFGVTAAALVLASAEPGHAAEGPAAPGPPASPIAGAPLLGGPGLVVASAAAGIPARFDCSRLSSPCLVLVRIGRSEIEDPAVLPAFLDAAAAAGLRVVVRLVDDGWAGPDLPVEEWATRIERVATLAGSRVAAWQILDLPAASEDPREYAYLLKRTSVLIRGLQPDAKIVLGALRRGDEGWARSVFEADAAPYVDLLAAADRSALAAVADLRDALHPSAGIWVTDAPLADRPRAAAAREYFEARHAGASAVLWRDPGRATPPDASELAAWLRGLLPPALSPATDAVLPFAPGPETATLTFYDPARRDGLAIYRRAAVVAPPGGEAETRAAPAGDAAATAGEWRTVLRAPVESLALADPARLTVAPLGDRPAVEGVLAPAGASLTLPLRDEVLIVGFRLATTAIPVQESLEVGAATELTAEEIIARERQFRAAQDARLEHYEAQATIAIHYRVAVLSESVDLVTENRLFVKDARKDYEQTALYVNGARWTGREPPHLPFLQPDKVQEMPLDIVLDEGYRYRLLGRNRVEGRDCYELEFTPVDRTRSLYEGRVFIDTRRFARVRMDAVQIGLKEPLLSSHVSYRFAPIPDSGREYWLPVEIRGQMVFEVLGQNLVVEREATHTGHVINRAGFDDRLAAALVSERPVFREDESGYNRVRLVDGQETLRRLEERRNTFLLFGASTGFDGDPGLPFAGVNFFDFDFRGTGTEFDVAWAGPFAEIAWTDPRLGGGGAEDGRPLTLSVRGSLAGIARREKNATGAGTFSEEYIDLLRNGALAGLAVPLGHFIKATLEARATYMNFSRNEDTDPDFVVPVDHLESAVLMRLDFNRLGYILTAWGEAARRSDWAPWGCESTPADSCAPPAPGAAFDPDTGTFTRRGLGLLKGFYFGAFQKINAGLSWFEGNDLDRFSRFEFGDFRAARVRGFNGSGIHFDRGLVAELSYGFTLARGFRVDTTLEHGWVNNEEDFGPGYERALGAGLGLQFSGPWSTLVHVRASRGLDSTIPDKGGDGDLRVTFFRTFDHWGRKSKERPAEPGSTPRELP